MENGSPDNRKIAVAAGLELLAILERHIKLLETEKDKDDVAVEVDRLLWEAVGAYGEAPDELTFTVRTRYDYTVVDEKAFLSAGKGVGEAVFALLERAGGKPLSALEVPSLETGSGILTVHLNNEPLVSADFQAADEPTDLLLVDPEETLAYVLDEPVYESRAEAEAAAKVRKD
jgi:hypothetical protein